MYEIEIFGSIVQEKTKDNQVTMTEIRNQLKDADGAEVLLLINSGGGSTINGSAILDEMDRYQGTINAHIMGICASMATQIASKCQSVSMNSNALSSQSLLTLLHKYYIENMDTVAWHLHKHERY